MQGKFQNKQKIFSCFYIVSIIVLSVYPLRHISRGVDMWDGGYNYGNFYYSGTEYMDSMWYFATWLANTVGSFFTRLPGGNTMLGMNVYTGMIISLTAVGAYLFCTRKMKMPAWLVFAGEMLAVSLCWVPSAALYNYLTYALLLAGSLSLYHGLVNEKPVFLVLAGVALGLNMGVRFSNLTEVALILAVWYYAFIIRKKPTQVLWDTGLCMLGYFGAVFAFMLIMSAGYGLDNYIEGIGRLFSMTENATDYSAFSMLKGMVGAYIEPEILYWLKRFALILVVLVGVCLIFPGKYEKFKLVGIVLATIKFFQFLVKAKYCTLDYYTYGSVYSPCVILFMMGIALSVFEMCRPASKKEEKLQALFVILLLCITTLGSNNAMYSAINNLFWVMPCLLWMIWRFVKSSGKMWHFPLKAFLVANVLLLTVQATMFGIHFTYERATGLRNSEYEVQGVPVLWGMHTSEETGKPLEDLYAYLQNDGLSGRECILYGNIPGVSYYMQLPPAINIWSDLRSYVPEVMLADLGRLEDEMSRGGSASSTMDGEVACTIDYNVVGKPLVILDTDYKEYMETGDLEGLQLDDETTLEKFRYLHEFMDRWDYKESYSNEKYTVYK